jgi:hypothetical protein
MAHVLVAQGEPPVGHMIAQIMEIEGHTATCAYTAEQMVQALVTAPHPLVVIYYPALLVRPWGRPGVERPAGEPDPYDEEPWEVLLGHVDTLGWHCFIETRAWDFPRPAVMHPFYERFRVTTFPLPFLVDDLIRLVNDMAS